MKQLRTNGVILDFTQEDIGNVDATNLLESLAREHRFQGQMPWTVIQHLRSCGLAAEYIESEGYGKYPSQPGFLSRVKTHDLHEAILRDIPTPVKQVLGEVYQQLEDDVQAKLEKALGIRASRDLEGLLKEIDRTMLYTEVSHFFTGEAVESFVQERFSGYKSEDPLIVEACQYGFDNTVNLALWTPKGRLKKLWVDFYRDVMLADHIW